MPKTVLYNMDAANIGEIDLPDKVFGASVNKAVIHQVVKCYLANQRQGTQSTKTRSEVSGGGKKPYRQKGTGRARQGSTRASQWVKGGVALGPKPRDYSYRVNKKIKALAMISALSDKVKNNEIIVVDQLSMPEIKTKNLAKMLSKFDASTKALIVTADNDKIINLSARNIYGVTASFVGMLNVYEILKADKFIISKQAVEKLGEVYGS